MVEYTINNLDYIPSQDNGKFVTAIFTPINISEFSHFGNQFINDTQEEYQEDNSPTQQEVLDFATNTLSQENILNVASDQYWKNDETDDVGDYVQDFDLELWSPSSNTTTYTEPKKQSTPNFNVDAASQYLLQHANPKSTHKCAAYVRKGLQVGGVNMDDRPRKAGQYLAYFRKKPQWTEINPSDVQKGDVCVITNSGDGHLAMWTGKNWVSDFIQRGPHVYTYAVDGKNTFYFRYTG